MKVKPKAKWKSIPMSHRFFTGNLEQAVCGGIEELADYTLLTKGKRSGKTLKRPQSAKPSSCFQPGQEVAEPAQPETDQPPVKKKKNVFNVTDANEGKTVEEVGSENKKVREFQDQKKSKSAIEVKKDSVVSKKKSKKKSKVAKPAINLEIFQKISVVKEDKENVKVVSETLDVISKPKQSKAMKEGIKKEKGQKKSNKCSVVEKAADMSEWKELFVSEEIVKYLAVKGFHTPTPIQRMTLTASLKGKMDIVGAAETGSGKTLAFGIPIIQGIMEDIKYEDSHKTDAVPAVVSEESETKEEDSEELESQEDAFLAATSQAVKVVDNVELDFDLVDEDTPAAGPTIGRRFGSRLRAVILTPTRELAMQIHAHLAGLAATCGLGVAVLVGGLSVEKQVRLLSRGPALVVATPGRLWDLVQEGNPHLAGLASIQYLAIDETDRMVEKGHFEELTKILEVVNENPDSRRQTFIMSATLSLVHKPPQHAKKQKPKLPKEKLQELMTLVGVKERRKVVDITRQAGTAETLSESVIHCGLTEKDFFLYYFLKSHPGRTVVFCNSIDCVRRLTNLFSLLDCIPLPLHAQLHQKQRLKNLDRFTASPTGLLVATDVAARGLDIPGVEHVVHYQVPRTSESYVHRSGRTARAARQGLSLLLVEPGEQAGLRRLCATLGRATEDSLPVFPVQQARLAGCRARLNQARKLDKLLLDDRKATVSGSWKARTAEEAELVVSDEVDSEEEFYQGRLEGPAGPRIKAARRELAGLLGGPLEMAGHQYTGAYPTMGGGLQTEGVESQTAVAALQDNLKYTQNLLRGQKKQNSSRNKYKGFKKKRVKKGGCE